jgi:uncharacterized protein
MKATLSLTHRCNLGCTYCYAGKTATADMSIGTAEKIVDMVMAAPQSGKKAEFSFFGGEPLLRFDLIKDVVSYIRKKEHETGVSTVLSLTSNGTLLTEPMLAFFKAENITLCISIDGPAETHNRNRLYKHDHSQGTFATVFKKLQLALDKLDTLQVNAVYGPETLAVLQQTVAFFTELRVPFIHLNPNIRAAWTAEDLAKLPQVCMSIAEHYIQCYQRGQEITVNMIDSKLVLFLKKGYAPEDRCGMGKTEWGFAPSGNIYPCERFIGEDDDLSLCLGNINTGFDAARRCEMFTRKGNRNEECATCSLNKYCMNWCGCTNYHLTGDTELAGPMLCALERASIHAAEHVFISLSQLNNELFIDHLMRCLCKGRTITSNQQNGGLAS